VDLISKNYWNRPPHWPYWLDPLLLFIAKRTKDVVHRCVSWTLDVSESNKKNSEKNNKRQPCRRKAHI